MSIPLVQNNEKDSINTSIIAIKRNIERINMLLGLSNSEEIDTSEFVKKSDIVDEVTSGNMQSVTSNAVYKKLNDVDTYASGAITVYKVGRICYLRIVQISGSTKSSPLNVGSLPNRFAPLSVFLRAPVFNNNTDTCIGQLGLVKSDLGVYLYGQNGSSFSANVTYVCELAYISDS